VVLVFFYLFYKTEEKEGKIRWCHKFHRGDFQ